MRAFADHLGVAVRTVSKWEAAGKAIQPRPDMQAVLDTALARADSRAQTRFEQSIEAAPELAVNDWSSRSSWDFESWADDLDRARLHADRLDFQFAARLMHRWLGRVDGAALGDRGLYLKGRSMMVLGDVQRDQGHLIGPHCARSACEAAHATFRAIRHERRVGQAELLLAVITEMSGDLEASALTYRTLAADERLSPLDRARSCLWVGTALTKLPRLTRDRAEAAIQAIGIATRQFETLDEPDEWSVSHQKLALAHLSAGDPGAAHRYMDIAVASRRLDSPLQQVRLDIARGHILLADTATRENGFSLLDGASELATKYKLAHQMTSIIRIRSSMNDRAARGS